MEACRRVMGATAPAIARAMEAQLEQGEDQACWLVKRLVEKLPVSCGGGSDGDPQIGNCICNPPSSHQKWSVCGVVESKDEAWELAESAIKRKVASFDSAQLEVIDRANQEAGQVTGQVEDEIRKTSTGFRWGPGESTVDALEGFMGEIDNQIISSMISMVSTDVVKISGPPIRSKAQKSIAFLMGMDPRLGQNSPLLSFVSAPQEVVQIIFSKTPQTNRVYVIQSIVKKARTLESLHIEWYGSCQWSDVPEEDEWRTDSDHCTGQMLSAGEGEIVVRQDESYRLNLKDGVAEARSIAERLVAEHETSAKHGQIAQRKLEWPGKKKYVTGAVFVYRPHEVPVKSTEHVLDSIRVTVTPVAVVPCVP